MLDKPKKDMIEVASRRLAGEKFSADEQCKLVFGPESRVCSYMVIKIESLTHIVQMYRVFFSNLFSQHVRDSGAVVMTMLKVVELSICHGLMEQNVVKIIGANAGNVFIVIGMRFKKLMVDGVHLLSEFEIEKIL